MAIVEVLTLDGEVASVRKDYKTILAEARAQLAYVREHSEGYRRWHRSGLAGLASAEQEAAGLASAVQARAELGAAGQEAAARKGSAAAGQEASAVAAAAATPAATAAAEIMPADTAIAEAAAAEMQPADTAIAEAAAAERRAGTVGRPGFVGAGRSGLLPATTSREAA